MRSKFQKRRRCTPDATRARPPHHHHHHHLPASPTVSAGGTARFALQLALVYLARGVRGEGGYGMEADVCKQYLIVMCKWSEWSHRSTRSVFRPFTSKIFTLAGQTKNKQTNKKNEWEFQRSKLINFLINLQKFPYLFFLLPFRQEMDENFFLQYLVNTEKQHPRSFFFFFLVFLANLDNWMQEWYRLHSSIIFSSTYYFFFLLLLLNARPHSDFCLRCCCLFSDNTRKVQKNPISFHTRLKLGEAVKRGQSMLLSGDLLDN